MPPQETPGPRRTRVLSKAAVRGAPMRILVLGGTSFLGRHFAEAAVAAGHDVTLFHRGVTGRGAVVGAREILGDRRGDLGALAAGRWQGVLDTSGYLPAVVARSVAALRAAADAYLFVSSISAYADFSRPGLTEAAALAELADPASEDIAADYGALKAACEAEVQRAFGEAALIVRPGLIVGPYDPSDRFTYWPLRFGRGGVALVPGSPQRPVQLIDARDLALWLLSMMERGTGGVYNATGPAERLTMAALVEACREASERPSRPVWVDDRFLVERNVGQWLELPLWLSDESHMDGMMTADIGAAVRSGLAFRPLVETARDTRIWAEGPGRRRRRKAGMTRARERALLAEWRALARA